MTTPNRRHSPPLPSVPCLLLLLLTVQVCTAVGVSAQASSGFALNRFDPAEAGSDWFVGDSLDMRGHLRPGVRLAADWAHRPLVRYDAAGNEQEVIIEDQLHGHLGFSLTLWERLRLGANLPVLLYQAGEQVMAAGAAFGTTTSTAVGDLRLSADVRLLGDYRGPVSIAVGAQLHAPTGDRAAFAGDGSVRFSPRLMLAGDLGPLAYSARIGYGYRPEDGGFGSIPTGSELAFAATAGIRAMDGALLLGPELWGTTVVSEAGAAFETATTPFELLFGGHYQRGDWKVGAGVGPGLNRGLGAPAVRAVASLTFIPDASDRDDDGILDELDACPDLPGTAHTDPQLNGCPDRDGDGIIDPDDACPDTPGVVQGDPKKNGCPSDRDGDRIYDRVDACPDLAGVRSKDRSKHGCPPDRDDDGIYDDDDACPDEAGEASDDPDRHGCPPDRDDDGIYDDDDACPDVPGVRSRDRRKNGCPPDSDGDGILDDDDACPEVPGVRSDDPEKHGCPIARVEDKQIKITERIEFKTNSAKILAESDVVLEAVLQILEAHPEIQALRVEGHTDNRGKPAYNRRLSQKRAASVVRWLVEHGIDRERLVANGFGQERPIADNNDKAGRQKNRRVEFHITKEDDSASGEDDDDEDGGEDEAADADDGADDGADDAEPEDDDAADADDDRSLDDLMGL